jgi:hypothetical protein
LVLLQFISQEIAETFSDLIFDVKISSQEKISDSFDIEPIDIETHQKTTVVIATVVNISVNVKAFLLNIFFIKIF